MARIHWCVPVLLVVGLTACDQGAQLAQQAASSAMAMVGEEVKNQTNAVIEQTVGDANQVLAPLGINASQVAGAIKQTTGAVISQALKPTSEWQQLNGFTGKTATEIGLLSALSPINDELTAVVGKDLPVLQAALAGGSVLKQEQVLYITAKEKNGGAWLSIDTANRKLEAGLIQNGQVQTFQSKGETMYRPSDVTALLEQTTKK